MNNVQFSNNPLVQAYRKAGKDDQQLTKLLNQATTGTETEQLGAKLALVSAFDLMPSQMGQVDRLLSVYGEWQNKNAAMFQKLGFSDTTTTTTNNAATANKTIPGLAVRNAFIASDAWSKVAQRLGLPADVTSLKERSSIVGATEKALGDLGKVIGQQRAAGTVDPAMAAHMDALKSFTIDLAKSMPPKDEVYRRMLAYNLVDAAEAASGKPNESGKLHNTFLKLKDDTAVTKALAKFYGADDGAALLGTASGAGAFANLGEAAGSTAVFSKPGKFTDEEFKEHVIPSRKRAATLAADLGLLDDAKLGALRGLNTYKPGETSVPSQVLSFVRQLVALAGIRSFRDGDGKLSADKIEGALVENAGKGQLNPGLVEALKPHLAHMLTLLPKAS